MQNSELDTGNRENKNSLIYPWAIALSLLLFLCSIQSVILLNFVLGSNFLKYSIPISLFLSISFLYIIYKDRILPKYFWIKIVFLFLAVILSSVFFAGQFYDMSWDGLWYHQTAVFQMANGWNPIYDPLHNFTPHLQDWVRHYAKGQWYIALSFYEILGNIEYAKASTWIALIASFFAVFAVTNQFGLSKSKSIFISIIISLNPVVVFELASYLVDGLMISFLTIFTAALFSWFKEQNRLNIFLMILSAILTVTTKQTGLVYLCFIIAGAGFYIIVTRRELLKNYFYTQSIALLLGIFIFGFNPYVTNTITRGNPFYPMLGSEKYPSLAQQGEDPIEKWETPHNMMGTSRFTRLAYAIFGRPGAQPYYPNTDASFMIPFNLGWDDFSIYYFHDVRISGFGPLFGVIFLLSAVQLIYLLFKSQISKLIITIFVITLISSLLISEHTWWARYGPQLWWLPAFVLLLNLFQQRTKLNKITNYIFAVLLIANMFPIYLVHYSWEVDATSKTNEQLKELRQYKNIEVDFQYFAEPFGNRLNAGGVKFTPVQKFECDKPIEFMSVSPGYPCAVRVCIKNN
jgi:hypothetical protein